MDGLLQRVFGSAEKVIGCNLPSLQDLNACRTLRRAGKIVVDPSHPGHKLLESHPLWQEVAVHQDQNLTPQEQLLPHDNWPR